MSDLQTEFERLRCSGDEHYDRKDYSIAAECYRAATERGPCEHNLYFKKSLLQQAFTGEL